MLIRPLILVLIAMYAISARSAETAWQEVAPEAQLRVISSGQGGDGTFWMALDLRMPTSLNTYWRTPGETGIPTLINVSANGEAIEKTALWPFPTRETNKGYVDHVYRGDFVLPFSVPANALPKDRPIDIEVIMGICSDICVPVRAEFAVPASSGEPDPGNALRIRQAVSLAPYEWTGDPADITASWQGDGPSLIVEIVDPQIETGSLIADSRTLPLLFGVPTAMDSPGTFSLPLIGPMPKIGGPVDIVLTFLTPDGPYEIVRTINLTEG